jgi:hypothetical protein
MARLRPPEPISAGVLLSYQCTAECRHCIYACSPKWRDWISEERLEKLLQTLAGKIAPSLYGPRGVGLNHGLHFSGGEPFLNFDLLLKAVEIANDLRIPSTFVETNCYWCTRDDVTRDKLEMLKARGMKGIMISVNPYYLEYVPFERTQRGIRIAHQVFDDGLMIYQWDYYVAFKKLGIQGKLALEDYLEMVRNENLTTRVEMFLMGRAPYALRERYRSYPASDFLDEPCQPPLLRDWHNHLDNYGNWMPGYCGGISLGDWQDMDRILDEGVDLDQRPVLRLLVQNDFRGLLCLAEDLGYPVSPDGYISKCHLCLDIRKHLSARDEFEELAPKELYAHLG